MVCRCLITTRHQHAFKSVALISSTRVVWWEELGKGAFPRTSKYPNKSHFNRQNSIANNKNPLPKFPLKN